MSIREAVIRWLSKTQPRYTFVTDVEWERSESLRTWQAPSEEDMRDDAARDPWRPKSTLGPL